MKFEVFKDEAGKYRWRLVDTRNGTPVAVSGAGYDMMLLCIQNIEDVMETTKETPIATFPENDPELEAKIRGVRFAQANIQGVMMNLGPKLGW